MKFRHVLFVLIGIAALSFASSYFGDASAPRSPKRVYLPNTLHVHPGSGHGFGYKVVYTVAAHKKYEGKTYAVIKSDEPDVEIWSPFPLLVAMKDGSSFHFTKAPSFEEALHRESDGNR